MVHFLNNVQGESSYFVLIGRENEVEVDNLLYEGDYG